MEFKDIQEITLQNAAYNAFKNATDFAYEAELFYKLKSYGHSASLSVLGIEELGKALGYKLLYRFKIIPIQGRINFDPNILLKNLQSSHLTKQSIAVIFSALSQFSSVEFQDLKKGLDKKGVTISYDNKTKKFDNFLEVTETFSTVKKWKNEIDQIPDFDKLKQFGFYVEIVGKERINIPRKMRANNAYQPLKVLKKMVNHFEDSAF